jgi:hypothetical protein
MTRKEAAAYLRVSERFLAAEHEGLKVVRLGRRVFYRREHLDAWMKLCTQDSVVVHRDKASRPQGEHCAVSDDVARIADQFRRRSDALAIASDAGAITLPLRKRQV